MTCFKVVLTPAWPICFCCPVAQGILSAIPILIFFFFLFDILEYPRKKYFCIFQCFQCSCIFWVAAAPCWCGDHRTTQAPCQECYWWGWLQETMPSYCLGSLLHTSAGPAGCKITSKDTRVVGWWKAAPGLPLSLIYWVLSWRIFANWRFWLVVCSIAKIVYLLLKWNFSFRFCIWIKDKDLEGSFFEAIAGPLQVKLSQLISPTTILSSLLFLYRPSIEKKPLYRYSLWGINRKRQ